MMAFRCKMCKLTFETEQGYELHRIAHLIKEMALSLAELLKFFRDATQEGYKALKQAQP